MEPHDNTRMIGTMKKHLKIFAGILAMGLSLGLSLPATAQTTNPSPGADSGTYVKATHGAWQVRCIRPETGVERCQMFQELEETPGNPVAEINIFALEPGQQAAAGAIIVTPLRTLLTEQLAIKFPGLERKRYPFAWCTNVGCVARIGLIDGEVAALQQGAQATVTIVPVATPTTPIDMQVSLQGFTAAFNAMKAANSPG